MHSKKFEIVRSYYELYLETNGESGWSVTKVRNAVAKGWITIDEFFEITGVEY